MHSVCFEIGCDPEASRHDFRRRPFRVSVIVSGMSIRPCRTVLQQRALWRRWTTCIALRDISTSPNLSLEPSSSSSLSQNLSTVEPLQGTYHSSKPVTDTHCIEPKFEVLGSVCSLLNVSIPALWPLYTRRGTLVSVHGQIENVLPNSE